MMTSKTPLLVMHLFGLCLTIGPVMVLDMRLCRLLGGKIIDSKDLGLIAALTPWVRIGLGLLWISGVGFLIFYAFNAPEALANPKLHAKIIIVSMLTLNGVLIEKIAILHLHNREGNTFIDPVNPYKMRLIFLSAAISTMSWYVPMILGIVKELNFACESWVLLSIYVTLILFTYATFELLAWLLHPYSVAVEEQIKFCSETDSLATG